MKKVVLFAAIASMGGAALLHAADKQCSPAEASRAQKAVDNVMTWGQLNKAWKDWRQCDTGEVADTYTDAMLRLLVDWKNVDAFADNMKDPEYKSFVEAHLKSPAAKDDLAAIRSRAKMSCPKGQDALCKDLATIAGDAASSSAAPDLSPMAPLTVAPSPPK